MPCWQCGASNRADASVCARCGVSLRRPGQRDDPRYAARSRSGHGMDRVPYDQRRRGDEDMSTAPRGAERNPHTYPPAGQSARNARGDASIRGRGEEWAPQRAPSSRGQHDPLEDPRAPGSLRRDGPASHTRSEPPRSAQRAPVSGRGAPDQQWRNPRADYQGGYQDGDRVDDRPAARNWPSQGGYEGRGDPYADSFGGGYQQDRRGGYSADPRNRSSRRRDSYGAGGEWEEPEPRYGRGSFGTRGHEARERFQATMGQAAAVVRRGSERVLSGSFGTPARGRRRPSRAPMLVATIVAVALVLAISGALVGPRVLASFSPHTSTTVDAHPFATYTPGPTPTVPGGYKLFGSARSHYDVVYPTGWSITQRQQTTQGQYDYVDMFAPALAKPTISVYVEQAAAASTVSDGDIIANEVDSAKSSGSTMTPVSGAPQTMLMGGEQWQRRDFTVGSGSSAVHEVVMACHHLGKSYVLVMVDAADQFTADNSAVFAPILNSFRFTS